jgi:hypothetical protein
MRNFIVAAISSLAIAAPMSEMEYKFINYVANQGKSYGTKEEYAFRMEQFAKTDAIVNKYNSEQSSFVLGHNKFSDYTHAEYKKMLGYKPIAADSESVQTN